MSSPSKRSAGTSDNEPGSKISKPDLMCHVILEKLPEDVSAASGGVRPVSLVWCPPDEQEETPLEIGVDMEVDEVKTESPDADDDTSVSTDDACSTNVSPDISPAKTTSVNQSQAVGISIQHNLQTCGRPGVVQPHSAQAKARLDTALANAVRKVAVNVQPATSAPTVAASGVNLTVKSILEAKRQASVNSSAARDNIRSLLASKLQMSTGAAAGTVPAPVAVIRMGNTVQLAPSGVGGANRPHAPFNLVNVVNTSTHNPTAVRAIRPGPPQNLGVPVAMRSVGPRATVAQLANATSVKVQMPAAMSKQPVQKTPVQKTPAATSKTAKPAGAVSAAAVTMNPNIDVSAIVLQSILPNGSQSTDSNTLADIAARMISKQQQLVQIIANNNSSSNVNAVVLNRSKQAGTSGDDSEHGYYICEDVTELKRLLLESNSRKHELARKLKDAEQKAATWQHKATELQAQVDNLHKRLALAQKKPMTVVVQQPTAIAAAATTAEHDTMVE